MTEADEHDEQNRQTTERSPTATDHVSPVARLVGLTTSVFAWVAVAAILVALIVALIL